MPLPARTATDAYRCRPLTALRVAVVSGLAAGSAAQAPTWTPAEAAWLRGCDFKVQVGARDGRPPIEFFDGDRHVGIVADYLALLGANTGIDFVSRPEAEWSGAGVMLRSAPDSAIDEAGWTRTAPFLRLPVVFVVRDGATDIEDVEHLAGRRLGVQEGVGLAVRLTSRLSGEVTVALLASASDALRSLARGDVDAAVMELSSAAHAIRAQGPAGFRIAGSAGFTVPCTFAVRSDLTELQGIMAKAIAAVPPSARDALVSRWVQGQGGGPWTWILWGFAAVGAALFGALAWNRTLARRVSARTTELASERIKREQSERLATLGTLMASVAHEVNNPIHAIMLNVPVLREAWRDALAVLDAHAVTIQDLRLANAPFAEMRDDLPRMVADIERSAVRIRDIVAAMRSYARDQSRQEHTALDLAALVRAALATRRALIAKSCRALTVEVPSIVIPVRGSRPQLEQVVAELVANACNGLTDPQQPIVVSLRVDASAAAAILEIRDGGRGMPGHRLQEVVRPFSAARGHEERMGLGLPMVAWIVQQHRGQLEIASTAGSGTCVSARIPLATT